MAIEALEVEQQRTLYGLVREELHANILRSDESIGREVLRRARQREDYEDLFLPLLRSLVQSQRRAVQREIERAAAKEMRVYLTPGPDFGQVRTEAQSTSAEFGPEAEDGQASLKTQTSFAASVPADLNRLRELVDQEVFVPEKGYRRWGSMTVEEHEKRIEFNEVMAAGIVATIDTHRLAIRVLQESGSATLDEFLRGDE